MVGLRWLSSEMKLRCWIGLVAPRLFTEQPQCMAGAIRRVGRRKHNRRLLISAAEFVLCHAALQNDYHGVLDCLCMYGSTVHFVI